MQFKKKKGFWEWTFKTRKQLTFKARRPLDLELDGALTDNTVTDCTSRTRCPLCSGGMTRMSRSGTRLLVCFIV